MSTADFAPPELPSLRWWDTAVAIMLAVLTTLGFFTSFVGDQTLFDLPASGHLVVLLVPVVAIAVLYVVLGRRALRRAIQDAPLLASGRVFIVLLVAIISVAVFLDPNYAVTQAIAYPMVWSMAERYAEAVLWSAGIAAVVAAALYTGLGVVGSEGALPTALYTGVLSFLFAVAMGTWIIRIFQQGQRHRLLAAELQSSQAEVATLSELAGAAAERERLSRELHDTLTQTLAGLVMLTEQVQRALDTRDLDRAHDRLERVSETARHAVSEARALVATTQPLAEGGLHASIERVASRLAADTELQVECELDAVTLSREVEVMLLRATQEGLANARRHARASRVSVRLEAASDGVRLIVDDDGIGVGVGRGGDDSGGDGTSDSGGDSDSNASTSINTGAASGFGLSGLADRVASAGGSAHISNGPLGGARLEVFVPSHMGAEQDEQNRNRG